MKKNDLAKQILDIAYLTGEFKLRSGQTSTEYFDKYRFESQPKLLQEIATHLKELIPKDTEVLAGLEMGGIPIATALSFATGLPVAFIRKEAKSYGTCKFAEGSTIKNKKVLIIEDVITTGGQVIKSTSDLRKNGANITDVLCVIYRGEGEPKNLQEINLNMINLFTMQELKNSNN